MEYIAAGILILPFAAIIIIKFISFIVPHHNEMQRADSMGEYRYWRKQLRCHRLCLLPFVNTRNVEKIYEKVFRS